MDHFKGIPIIGDDPDFMFPDGCGTGYVPRDYSVHPESMYQAPSEMELIDESEYDARYEEEEKEQSSLEHLYLGNGGQPVFVNLDQGREGYCWTYSVGHCDMLVRVRDHQPVPRLNPHAVGAIIKHGVNEGGWCGLSQEMYRDIGCPVEGNGPGEWPLQSRDLRYDTPEMRAKAAANRITSDWVDLTRQVFNRTLTERQLFTSLFKKTPCAIDVRKWGHSIAALRVVRVERGRFLPLILNSWKNWGRHGLAILDESMFKTIMGAVATRTTTAA